MRRREQRRPGCGPEPAPAAPQSGGRQRWRRRQHRQPGAPARAAARPAAIAAAASQHPGAADAVRRQEHEPRPGRSALNALQELARAEQQRQRKVRVAQERKREGLVIRRALPLLLGLLLTTPARAAEIGAQVGRGTFMLGESTPLEITVRGSGGVSDPSSTCPGLEVLSSGRDPKNFSWVSGKSTTETTVFRATKDRGEPRRHVARSDRSRVKIGGQILPELGDPRHRRLRRAPGSDMAARRTRLAPGRHGAARAVRRGSR